MKTLFLTSILFIFSLFSTLAQDGLSCGNAIDLTEDSVESLTFPGEEEFLYLTLQATSENVVLQLDSIENELLPAITKVDVYNYDCQDLTLHASFTDAFDFTHTFYGGLKFGASPEENYLIKIERANTNGFSEVDFNAKFFNFQPIGCNGYNLPACELMENGGFTHFNSTNYNPGSPFNDDEVCDWEVGDEDPTMVNDNGNKFVVLHLDTSSNNMRLESILKPFQLVQGQTYQLSFKIKQASPLPWPYISGFFPRYFMVRLLHSIDVPQVDPITKKRTSDVYKISGQQIVSLPRSQYNNNLNFTTHTFTFTADDDYDRILFYPWTNQGNQQKAIAVDDISLEYDLVLEQNIASECASEIGPDHVNPNWLYSWSPNIDLSDPSAPNPLAFPTTTTTYTLSALTPSGCILTASTTVQGITSSADIYLPDGSNASDLLQIQSPDVSPNKYTNKDIYIHGEFIVDSDVVFENCNFFMGEDARIEIINYANFEFKTPNGLNNYSIGSCNGTFWDGIYVDAANDTNNNLTLEGSLNTNLKNNLSFTGSRNGIHLLNKPETSIKQVAFDGNEQSLYIEGSSGNNDTKLVIWGCTFECSTPLEDENNNLYYPDNAIFIKDYHYEDNPEDLSIGKSSSAFGVEAYLAGSAGNMVIENSDVFIENFTLKDFNNSSPFGGITKNDKALVVGFRTSTKHLNIDNCNFLSNFLDITVTSENTTSTSNNYLFITDNYFDNAYAGLGSISISRNKSSSPAEISGNTFKNAKTGIVLNDCENVLIDDNTFDMEEQSTQGTYTSRLNNYSQAIFINNLDQNSLLSSPQYNGDFQIEITNNEIQHSKSGIQTEFAYVRIQDNDILEMNDKMTLNFGTCGGFADPPCPPPAYGIRSIGDVVSITGNKVENDASLYGSSQPSADPQIVGISLENTVNISANSTVNCNKVENTGIGFRFLGDNGSGTTVEKNTMQDHYYGFVLKNSGFIGDVGNSTNAGDNEWKGSAYDISKTFADNSLGRNCTLHVQNTTTYNPNIDQQNHTTIANEYIRKNTTVTGSSAFSCTAPALTRQPTNPKDKPMLQKSGGNGNAWGRQISKGNSSEYVFAPDSMLMLNKQLLFRQLMKDTTLLADTMLRNFADSMKRTPNGKALGHSKQANRSLNVRTTANNNFEANLILISPILEKMGRDSILSGGDTANLLTVANKCPFYDGIAVYQARSALYQLGFSMIANSCETTLPTHKGQKRLRSVSVEERGFVIYPNPTKENVNLRYEVKEDQEIHFELHDIIGKKVLRKRLASSLLHTINLEQMHHGIYIYRLTNESRILQSGKLIIE